MKQFVVRHSELNQQIAVKKAHHFLGLDQFLDILMSASEYKFVLQSIKHLEIVLNLENGVLSYSTCIPLDSTYLSHLIILNKAIVFLEYYVKLTSVTSIQQRTRLHTGKF